MQVDSHLVLLSLNLYVFEVMFLGRWAKQGRTMAIKRKQEAAMEKGQEVERRRRIRR